MKMSHLPFFLKSRNKTMDLSDIIDNFEPKTCSRPRKKTIQSEHFNVVHDLHLLTVEERN